MFNLQGANMAIRKVLFILSLTLLINPALHCMDYTEENEVILTLATVAFTIAAYVGCLELQKQALLCKSKNTNVFTAKKSTGGTHKFFQITGENLGIFAILSASNKDQFSVFHKQVVQKVLPNWFKLLFYDKKEFDLNNDCKISKIIVNSMKEKNLDGIVALMTPPDDQKKRKTLVVSFSQNWSDCSYNAYHMINNKSVKKIKTSIFKSINNGHIILVTNNVSQQNLEDAMQNNPPLSNIKKSKKDPKYLTTTAHDRLNKYQQNIIDKVFSENGGDSKKGKAILMIPSQHS